MDVKCPGCRRIFYETTEHYDPDKPASGDMLELKEPWRSRGWGKYESGHTGGKTVLASEMLCVMCGAPLAPSGRVMVVGEPEIDVIHPGEGKIPVTQGLYDAYKEILENECPQCGWSGKTQAALKRHVTMVHKGE